MSSLWGKEFDVPTNNIKKIIDKVNNPKVVKEVRSTNLKSKKLSISDRLNIINADVNRILGVYRENTIVIKSIEELHSYIDNAIYNGVIAIDTETNNSLDPLTCKIMGACIYTPNSKSAYVPINHTNLMGDRLEWQITELQLKDELDRLSNTKIITHNGKFDYQVIKCTCSCDLKIYWDTMVGARLLNENEKAGLKYQYISKIDSSIEKYSIDHLFENIEYNYVDVDIFALYSATDAYMTYKLYEWQLDEFNKKDNSKLKWLLLNVEMPVLEVASSMELTGIDIDQEYAKRLSDKYNHKLQELDNLVYRELDKYASIVDKWKSTDSANEHPIKNGKQGKSKAEQLDSPINLASPTQLAIFLYDILQVGVIDKKSPRGTGEDILSKINLPICDLILQRRGLLKLLNTYIDKLPKGVCPKDGRLHAHFNQLGTDTGRFSSSEPNLQNIPSHNKEIRLMFKASEGNVLVGSDFSQQEPRLLSNYSLDENMMNAYKEGKDLYATIASGVYKNDYWDNMEHHQDGTPNPDGKKRRSACKVLLLGIMYGMGAASIANDIHSTPQEAQKIIDDFYNSFPKVREWINHTKEFVKDNGYVEDFWGRRRRLPDINLPKYEVSDLNGSSNNGFNPLIGSDVSLIKIKSDKVKKYEKLLSECKWKRDVDSIKSKAFQDGVKVVDNTGYIALAERQCVNARVQGGASTMSKLAMIKVHHNEELRKLGFKVLLQIHDELIGECPKENAEKVATILTQVMKDSAKPMITVPFKCDPTIEESWYETDYIDSIRNEYNKLLNDMSKEQAYNKIRQEHSEMLESKLMSILN